MKNKSNEESLTSTDKFVIYAIFSVMLIGLKLFKVVNLSWLEALMPIIVLAGCLLVAFVMFLVVLTIQYIVEEVKKRIDN